MHVGVLSLAARILDADGGPRRRCRPGVRALCISRRGRLVLLTIVVTLGLSAPAGAQSGVLAPTNTSPPTISGTPRDALTLTSTDGTCRGS